MLTSSKILEIADVKLREAIREVPDFPQTGINFKDITPVWANSHLLQLSSYALMECLKSYPKPDFIVAPEARGFITGACLANDMGIGFIPARKESKLPRTEVWASYGKEYGPDRLGIHVDDIPSGSKVVIHDDLLATGGTVSAVMKIVEEMSSEVIACCFITELRFLKARELIQVSKSHPTMDIYSLVSYDKE